MWPKELIFWTMTEDDNGNYKYSWIIWLHNVKEFLLYTWFSLGGSSGPSRISSLIKMMVWSVNFVGQKQTGFISSVLFVSLGIQQCLSIKSFLFFNLLELWQSICQTSERWFEIFQWLKRKKESETIILSFDMFLLSLTLFFFFLRYHHLSKHFFKK